MALIEFKDYPDTSTKIDSQNLNNNFNELNNSIENLDKIKDDLYNELFYKDKDIFEITNSETNRGVSCPGFITSGSTQITFSIPLQKSLKNINTININSISGLIRHPNGGYIVSGDFYTNNNSIEGYISKNTNTLLIYITFPTAVNFTNNCPVSVYIQNAMFTFN